MGIDRLYKTRFDANHRAKKEKIWKVLCRDFFQKYVRLTDTVLDIGAGYCEFINHIQCARKIAVDLNPDTPTCAGPHVQVIQTSSSNLGVLADDSINVVFASNFFEHLPDKQAFISTLQEIHRVLCPGGRLLILQPNIRFLHGEYWDFLDHYIPITDRSLVEALKLVELQPVEVRPRFLPYTTKRNFPQHPSLVRLYLRISLAQRLLGKQAWVVAVKPERA